MENFNNMHDKNRAITGIFVIAIGVLMLAYKMGVGLPWWLFSWPMFLIALGMFIGIKSNFKNPGWFFPTVVGTIFLIEKTIPGIHLKTFIAPIILIAVGTFILLKPKNWTSNRQKRRNFGNQQNENSILGDTFEEGDQVNSVAIFSGNIKSIITKDFKGGNMVNIMGGTEINLMQSDIKSTAKIDAVQIMGGAKLIVPADWVVVSQIVSIFGGFEDKRSYVPSDKENAKVLVIEGVNIFGGIEVKSY